MPNQNTRRKRKLHVLGNIESRYHQTNLCERKKKRIQKKTPKLLETKHCNKNLVKQINI